MEDEDSLLTIFEFSRSIPWNGWGEEEKVLKMHGVGGIYFLQGEVTKRVKIGKSKDIKRRLISFTVGSADILSLRCIVACSGEHLSAVEQFFHTIFHVYWSHGEWFNLPEEALIAVISCEVSEDFVALSTCEKSEEEFLRLAEYIKKKNKTPQWMRKYL